MEQCPEYPKGVFKATFGFSEQSFSKAKRSLNSPQRQQAQNNKEEIRSTIRKIFVESKCHAGIALITEKLRHHGIYLSKPTVRKYARDMGLFPVRQAKKGKYNSYDRNADNVAPNLIKRDFQSELFLSKISTDITEFSLNEEKLYLSAFIDAKNKEVVAYSLGDSPSANFVTSGLIKLVDRIPKDQECVINSDQGVQYHSEEYMAVFAANPNLVRSMSRKGNCLDNYVVEQFFGKLKSEFYYANKFNSMSELKSGIVNWIHYYNHERLQENLSWQSPVSYRLLLSVK